MKIVRKADYEGLVVQSRATLGNGVGKLPAGTLFLVKGWLKGLTITSFGCPCCEVNIHITRVQPHDVVVLDNDHNKSRLEWNKSRKYIKTDTYENPSTPRPEYTLCVTDTQLYKKVVTNMMETEDENLVGFVGYGTSGLLYYELIKTANGWNYTIGGGNYFPNLGSIHRARIAVAKRICEIIINRKNKH